MKRTILVLGLIVLMIALIGCKQTETTKTEGKLAPDGVDVMPDISIDECLEEIMIQNPEMTEQAAKDNCYTIEAVNKDDKSVCDQVSEAARANCLAMFE